MDSSILPNMRRFHDAVTEEALARPDAPLYSFVAGEKLVAVSGGRTGLASPPPGLGPGEARRLLAGMVPDTLHALARWFAEPPALPELPGRLGAALGRAVGLAAVNALLVPPPGAAPGKGQELLLRGEGLNVAVVGHFPFVERMRDRFANLWVLELDPRPGDLPASAAAEVLPRAAVAAITATTLINGTFAGLLALCRAEARVVVLGPSTPYSSALFAGPVAALAGSVVTDPEAALADVAAGNAYRELRGVTGLVWRKENEATGLTDRGVLA